MLYNHDSISRKLSSFFIPIFPRSYFTHVSLNRIYYNHHIKLVKKKQAYSAVSDKKSGDTSTLLLAQMDEINNLDSGTKEPDNGVRPTQNVHEVKHDGQKSIDKTS